GIAVALTCLLAGQTALLADQGAYPTTEEAKDAAYKALHWQNAAGEYKLPKSNAIVKLPSGYIILLGAAAERYSWLASGIEFAATEAVISYDSGNATSEVYYEWRDEGFVSDDDWDDVDGDALLKQYKEGTENSNKERVANGFEPMHVIGWLEPPHYDKEKQ